MGLKETREEGIGKKQHYEKLNDLYSLPYTFSGDQIEKNEMGQVCSTYGGRGEVYIGLWWENLRERDHLEDTGLDGRIILRWIFMKLDVRA